MTWIAAKATVRSRRVLASYPGLTKNCVIEPELFFVTPTKKERRKGSGAQAQGEHQGSLVSKMDGLFPTTDPSAARSIGEIC